MLGITLSHSHLTWLGIQPSFALEQLSRRSLSYVRLGSYWSEIESRNAHYDYQALTEWLDVFERRQQNVVLTVGVKAPRWPEFYYPDFITHKDSSHPETQSKLLDFIRHTITHVRHYRCISHWQVENEPLDPSGPINEHISSQLLEQEISLVRQLDPRPILLTLWGNALRRRGFLPQVSELADIVGIDLYYRQFAGSILGKHIYTGPENEAKLRQTLSQSSKPIWITELQAEPWEKDEASYLGNNPASISPELLEQNLQRTKHLPVAEILLWGFEYWLYRSQQGDQRYLELFDRYNHKD